MAVKISELIATRLCHDLAGPLGAVNNGVEFWKENDPTMIDSSIDLVETSAKEAISRLLFYRQAFGSVYEGAGAQWESLVETATHYLIQRKIKLEFSREEYTKASEVPSALLAKMVLNLLLVIADGLIYGGIIRVKLPSSRSPDSLEMIGEGKNVKPDHNAAVIVSQPKQALASDLITSRNVQAYIAAMVAERLQLSLFVHYTADRVVVRNQ